MGPILGPFLLRLNRAFAVLREAGYVVRRNYGCCNTCAGMDLHYELGHNPDRLVLYNRQRARAAEETGQLFLTWSGDGPEIAKAFLDAGMEVRWTGLESCCVMVQPPGHARPTDLPARPSSS
jgi:hypothetical protein